MKYFWTKNVETKNKKIHKHNKNFFSEKRKQQSKNSPNKKRMKRFYWVEEVEKNAKGRSKYRN